MFSIIEGLYQSCPCDGLTRLPIQPPVQEIKTALADLVMVATFNGLYQVVVKLQCQPQFNPVHPHTLDYLQLLVTDIQTAQLMKFGSATYREQHRHSAVITTRM